MVESKIEKSFNDFQNKVLETSIQLVNNAQSWKVKAIKLSKKFKACLDCGSQKDYVLETMTCKNCQKNYGK